jgi:hypothetical protein
MKTFEEYEKEYEEKYRWKENITLAEYIYGEWLKESKTAVINNFYYSEKDDENV